MAAVLTACPRGASARADASGVARRGLFSLFERLVQDRARGRLRLAVPAVIAGFCLAALVPPGSLPLALTLTAMALGALALWPAWPPFAPTLGAPGEQGPPETPAKASDRAPPGPLPFLADRIVLEPKSCAVSRLAEAASRTARATVLKRVGWSDLMARVSHELRTPLNAVIGFSDVMNAELLGPVGHPRYREYARHIRDCGRELLKSAEDTLAITSLLDIQGAGSRLSTVDLAGVAAEAWAFLSEAAAQRAICLELTIPEGLEVASERRPLRQVLVNLFTEAVDRAGDNGLVTLSACADGDLVQLEVLARASERRPSSVPEASLAICLARALLELQGAALVEIDDASCTWRSITVLPRPAQPDFFAMAHHSTQEAAYAS